MLTRESRILVGQGREEVHPLFNSAILRNILGFMDLRTLKSARQSCLCWNEETNSLVQNRSKVTITFYTSEGNRHIPALTTFMKYVESVRPENVFFRNFELLGWCLHSSEEEMTQFWLQCGQHIRNLTLKDHFSFYEESYVRNVFFNWTPNMESLHLEKVRFLNLKDTTREDIDIRKIDAQLAHDLKFILEPMPKFGIQDIQPNYNLCTFHLDPLQKFPNFPLQWKEIFIAYPNLKTLSLRPVVPNEKVDNSKELLMDLIEFQEENPNKLQNLKHLDIFSDLDGDGKCAIKDEDFEQAMKLNFKLDMLEIFFLEMGSGKLSYSTVGKYITKLSPTLRILDIFTNGCSLTVFPPLGKGVGPTFPNLTFLEFELSALSSDNVGFLRNTPRLKNLVIGLSFETPDAEPRLFFNTITLEPLPSLQCLHIRVDILTEDCVRKIGEWFPNLSDFGAVLDDKLLWAVYTFLGNSVEVLEVLGKDVTDAGITGASISRQELELSSISEHPDEPFVKKQKGDGDKETIHGISIGQMKKLRHLTINAVGIIFMPISNIEIERFTDDCVYNGFIFLTELKYLSLQYGIGGSISEKAFRDLCSQRNVMTLDTLNFYRGEGIRVTPTSALDVWRQRRCTKI